MMETDWHHAPLHRFVPGAVYMITAGTLHKAHLFKGDPRMDLLHGILLDHLASAAWIPHAWACFPNHYHVIVGIAETSQPLSRGIKGLHGKLSIALNKLDGAAGRKVMYQFWDKCITFDSSYYSRLNYVMNNPVKHGCVADAQGYRWCSAAWFHQNNDSAFCRRVASCGHERLEEPDDF